MRHLRYSLRQGVRRWPLVAFHKKRIDMREPLQKYSFLLATLLVALLHVLDDFFGHVLGTDVVRSIGDRLFDLCNLLQTFFVDGIETVLVGGVGLYVSMPDFSVASPAYKVGPW